jgi:hypothetical protein
MHSQHTSALNSTHMCVDAVCRIARNFGRRSYVKREEKGPFMSTSHNLCVRLISYEPAHNSRYAFGCISLVGKQIESLC